MAILNYTTSVPVDRTMGELVALLANHGASRVGAYYEAGTPVGLGFAIATDFGLRSFDLPANIDGVLTVLEREWPKTRAKNHSVKRPDRAQATRVAWRILKDWVEAQVALIEAGLSSIDVVMLPYMVTDTGRTVAVEYRHQQGHLAIEAAT